MPMSLDAAVEALCRAAGWRDVPLDDEGVRHFLLEDGLDLDVRSPDGRVCILSADLGAGPEADQPDADDQYARIGRMAAAVARAQRSTLSVHEGRLSLWRRVPLDAGEADFCREAREFLNDQAWWRGRLDGADEGAAPVSPFSFGASGWMPGQLVF